VGGKCSIGGSLHQVIYPLVERAAQPLLDLFAKAFAVYLGQVCIIRLPALPDLNDAEMVGSHYVLQKLESHQSLVLAAIRRELTQGLDDIFSEIWEEIDVCNNVQCAGSGLGFLLSRSRDWEDNGRQPAQQGGTRAQKNYFQWSG
jgi:hypothetical protein